MVHVSKKLIQHLNWDTDKQLHPCKTVINNNNLFTAVIGSKETKARFDPYWAWLQRFFPYNATGWRFALPKIDKGPDFNALLYINWNHT